MEETDVLVHVVNEDRQNYIVDTWDPRIFSTPSKMPNLSDDMLSALTKQAACEAYNSNTYLQIALFWDGLNYGGSKLLKNISIIILNG